MHYSYRLLVVALVLVLCLGAASCAIFPHIPTGEQTTTDITTEETTPEETTPEETTPEATTPAVTEPDFSNDPDPDGTKRY